MRDWAPAWRPSSPRGAVVLLVGPLGAGKTVLARGIARGLGIEDQLVSPTYTIISEYRAGATILHHVDLYRIEGREQMENLGLEDIMAGDGYVLVEWGEKIGEVLAASRAEHLRVTLSLAARRRTGHPRGRRGRMTRSPSAIAALALDTSTEVLSLSAGEGTRGRQ